MASARLSQGRASPAQPSPAQPSALTAHSAQRSALSAQRTSRTAQAAASQPASQPAKKLSTEGRVSLFCAISGQPPLVPVVSSKSGHVYEKSVVLKYLADNEGKDPITGEQIREEDLVEVKTAPSTPSAPPRPPTFTSIPSLLHTLQSEWDATMLECLELRRQGSELRQELSHALYKEDAAMRVLARVSRERDEAREALASVKATLGSSFSTGAGAAAAPPAGEVEMEVEQEGEAGLPAAAKARVEDTAKALSSTRKKRKPAAEYATPADVKSFVQTSTVPSLHGTKPPGLSAVELVKDGELIVTGGLDKAVQVYDRSTSKILASLKGHTKKVTAVVATAKLTDDSSLPSMIVSGSADKSVRVWAPNGGKTVYGAMANLSLGGEVTGLSLHPSESLVASSSSDGTWAIHDLASEKPATLLTGGLADAAEGTGASAIAFHPDGAIFAVGSTDSLIRVFETPSGKCVATFPGHSESGAGAISSLSFSENGYTLASSAASSSEVKLWDLRKLTNSANIPLPEGAVVNLVRFDPSAQFLAVVGTDLRVFANKSWELLASSEDNQSELTGVAFGQNGKEIAVGGIDRTVRFLSAPASE